MRPHENVRTIAALATALTLVCGTALADDKSGDCKVEPGAKSQDRVPTDTEETASLSDCDGVLTPAPVGDRELVEPAPDVGETPVITPEEIPDQQPAD
ncbi:hypothetical protein FIU93_09305 [Labrenzia sp. THAF35]|jgi:hypothetical protein|uniref:hypothetical protein n=1 Tax=Labrenzia sp. THAF35 TaxID=2587854 RepID=UPI001268B3D6|nr:hypothetical protein [Labrenzia sp. THAF35]QFT66970.1 hypothetical protein FIU93_09305 [Labrenzia sp. THAF35]